MLYKHTLRCRIVFVLDDSGSMLSKTDHGTRWSELQEVCQLAIEIATKLNPEEGVDIVFLNRRGESKIKNWAQALPLFSPPPTGGTDLSSKTAEAFAKAPKDGRDLLVIIATDGVFFYYYFFIIFVSVPDVFD